MGLLRSEKMKCGTLVVPAQRARHFVDIMGSHANVEFLDMHAHEMIPTRPYKKYIQRIEEVERIVRFLFEEVKKLPNSKIYKNDVQGFLENESAYNLSDMENTLKKLYVEFNNFRENNARLVTARNAAIEEKYVAEFASQSVFTAGGRGGPPKESFEHMASQSLLEEGSKDRAPGVMFSHTAGVLAAEDQERFARFLFRATRGNSFTNFWEIPEKLVDPATGKPGRRSVFVVYYQDARSGGRRENSAMHTRIQRACVQFGINIYPWLTSGQEASQKLLELNQSAQEKNRAVSAFEQFMSAEAARLCEKQRGGNSLLEEWRLFAMKEKSIYHTLNQFEGSQTLRCDLWYPTADENEIRQLLLDESKEGMGSGSAMLVTGSRSTVDAPTYFKKNALLEAPMELVFTYGVPRYGEASPALLTTITFPFIFGIMYGDIGHGFLLMCGGIWLLWQAENLKFSQPGLYQARYLIFCMGFFATYAGFLYNDFVSLGTNIFGSRWECGDLALSSSETECQPKYDLYNGYGPADGSVAPEVEFSTPYPFGIDPAWTGSTNELLFMNSLKMKLSVIIGVTQMVVGVLLRFSNAIHERSCLDFFCECLPMLVFMLCFFAFMDYMILYKWVTPMAQPPSIINSLICMAMRQEDHVPLWTEGIGSIGLSSYLVLATALSVPMMLFPKPMILYFTRKKSSGDYAPLDSGEAAHEEEDFGEVVIHQVIETIEFVLGTVSHTASYLRQWALSLAHQQLSLVFFEKTLKMVLSDISCGPLLFLKVFFAFAVWFVITVAVLLGMDVLECFLHTLRLHWVEFQSKFFKADGRLFFPFRHDVLLSTQDD